MVRENTEESSSPACRRQHETDVTGAAFSGQLVVKVLMNDGSAKTLMVDERQTVREVLDNMFEKTHCDCNVDWSLCETNPELQLGELPPRGTPLRTAATHRRYTPPLHTGIGKAAQCHLCKNQSNRGRGANFPPVL
ncbi:Amyloid beta A4 precursor protein-binding family B member 1-interacting protein [Liparis tanakae]|uniref:Amyloid beta A4 protein-binding family B member 1-interacting protein n=1 Tax=Liparis tanakae TaxID=230148 RepID=A0A4Z2GUP6_9TELE|nr:Amyloid beta A4 precursor protein-binding family B member 1-interacting protein [Liparis tanakae]